MTFLWVLDCWLVGRGRFPWFCSKMEICKSFILLNFLLLLGVPKHCCKTWFVTKLCRKSSKSSRHALLGNHERVSSRKGLHNDFPAHNLKSFKSPRWFGRKKYDGHDFSLQMYPTCPLKIDGWSWYILFSYKENGPPFQVTFLHLCFLGGWIIIKNQLHPTSKSSQR